MDKNWLIERLRQPSLLQKGDEGRLRELIATYPYFAAPYLLLGKSLKDQEHPAFENLLPLISIQAFDRKLLFRLIHESQEEAVREAVVAVPQKEESIPIEIKEESVFVEKTNPARAPLFEVNFAGVEKEEEEVVERPVAELPEITLGWKRETDLETGDTETEDNSDYELPSFDSAQDDETGIEDTQASTPLSLTEEDLVTGDIETEDTQSLAEDNSNYQLPITNYLQEPISRTDFFHWLDKLNEKEEEVPQANYQLPTTNYTKPTEETISSGEKEFGIKEQENIIDRFIEKNPSVSRIKSEFYNPIDKARESEKLDDELVTETLARIFASQEKYERAIAAYEKLQLKYPQKSNYFAALIQELKEKLN